LSNNKSPGHDEIPIIFIKQAVQIMAPIIASLINFSFQLDSFPNNLKIVKKSGRNHSLFILNGMQTNTIQHRPTPKSIK